MRARALVTTLTLLFAMAGTAAASYDPNDPSGGGSAAPTSGEATTASAGSSDDSSSTQAKASGGAAYGDTTGTSQSTNEFPVVPGFTAKILKDGRAAAPSMAPAEVQKAIWAANHIIGRPYVYGGGHNARFAGRGYDCSGTVSYALHGARLLRSPLDSGSFMRWGAPGKGSWITVYTNPGHAFAIIAGLRLDTSAAGDPSGAKGPRWRPVLRSTQGFVARHPARF